jgi:hypothetical protein
MGGFQEGLDETDLDEVDLDEVGPGWSGSWMKWVLDGVGVDEVGLDELGLDEVGGGPKVTIWITYDICIIFFCKNCTFGWNQFICAEYFKFLNKTVIFLEKKYSNKYFYT